MVNGEAKGKDKDKIEISSPHKSEQGFDYYSPCVDILLGLGTILIFQRNLAWFRIDAWIEYLKPK